MILLSIINSFIYLRNCFSSANIMNIILLNFSTEFDSQYLDILRRLRKHCQEILKMKIILFNCLDIYNPIIFSIASKKIKKLDLHFFIKQHDDEYFEVNVKKTIEDIIHKISCCNYKNVEAIIVYNIPSLHLMHKLKTILYNVKTISITKCNSEELDDDTGYYSLINSLKRNILLSKGIVNNDIFDQTIYGDDVKEIVHKISNCIL